MIRTIGSIAVFGAAVAASAVAAEQVEQQTFSSPDKAAEALFAAAQARDQQALSRILGEDTKNLFSGDERQDDRERQIFLDKYREMHRTAKEGDVEVLYIGAENWPFPFPLASRNGAWAFDAESGREEIVFRRIGENELAAIEICKALETLDQQDAVSIVGNTAPLEGYYFRKIPAAGNRPAFVAYPAEYASSGVMTFVVSPDSVTYERDLGPDTAQAARAVSGDKLDASWQAVQ
jgi:hypothetical protein